MKLTVENLKEHKNLYQIHSKGEYLTLIQYEFIYGDHYATVLLSHIVNKHARNEHTVGHAGVETVVNIYGVETEDNWLTRKQLGAKGITLQEPSN